MEVRDRARVQLTREVVRRLLDADFRSSLPEVAAGHDRKIIVVLPDDTVEYVFDRVAKVGGTASVLVGMNGRIGVFECAGEVPGTTAAQGEEEDCPVHPDTQADMLVTYLKRKSGFVRCKLLEPDHAFHFVTEVEAPGGPQTLQDTSA
jgi:hypothetical protein